MTRRRSFASKIEIQQHIQKSRLRISHNKKGPPVLWVHDATSDDKPAFFESRGGILNNLSSFSVWYSFRSKDWRESLDQPSQTLRHLEISMHHYYGHEEGEEGDDDIPEIPTLRFPPLIALHLVLDFASFPSWMDISSDTVVILESSKY